VSLALVIGGTRSGKSAHAERLALASGLPVRYVATADGSDPSMARRIAQHVARRPGAWTTVEAGDDLAAAVDAANASCVLVDGLGTWIAGALHRAGAFEGSPDAGVLERVGETVRVEVERLATGSGSLIVVAEEAGNGLLPPDAVSRAWLDLLGEATQRLSDAADSVYLVVAGRSIALTPPAAADANGLRVHGDSEVRPGEADHAVNVLDGGPPQWLRDVLTAALENADRYPDEREACAALAALHGRDPGEIVPTNGAAEALWLLPLALRPRLAACVHPGFTEAEAALHVHGVPVARVLRDPDRAFALDPDAVPADADLVIAGNPASPSGTLDPASALLALRRPGRTVVVDEAFMGLVPGEPGSLAGARLDDVIVVRSLTKALAVPGLRVGYAIAPTPLATKLRAARAPWAANALALAALSAAAAHPAELAAIAERAAAERADLEQRLANIDGLRSWPSAANFCLVEVPDGPAVVAALRAGEIAVRPAASFPGLGAGHLRITARDPERNAALADALEEALR
jgi:histidinol-phosphate/aromatic aminotransferase/cobyric acid decarboxylase-like protein